MPTSAPGSRRGGRHAARSAGRGFTLIEVMIVVALVAVAAGLISLALRDSAAGALDREAARLSALLETARAEARAAGLVVRWMPTRQDSASHFRFTGLPNSRQMPTRWLDERVEAEVVGANAVLLGPEAILPPQRIVLQLEDRRVELVSDGLGPFAPPAVDEAKGS